jgi:anaerobic magnesium-protoporphyrin IX monomethyl ester cyclase
MKIAFVQFSAGIINSGSGYVMGSLCNAGHNVQLYNINNTFDRTLIGSCKDVFNFSLLVTKIIVSKFDIIFISCLSVDVVYAYKLAREIKKFTTVPIVMGGVHPTIVKEQILSECFDIDFICVGEGEEFAVEFVEKFPYGDYKSIKNLGYRENGIIKINPVREPQNLESLSILPYHLYPKKYVLDAYGFAYVKATRGCPFACTFCCNSIFLKLYPNQYLRSRPIDSIISEIKLLQKEYFPKFIFFSDEMLLTNKKYASELFKRIKFDTNIPFAFLARVEYLTNDIVKLAADCGCKYIAMGVECGDEEFRKRFLNRYMTNDKIIEAFKICRDNNIYTTSFNIIGYPFSYDEELTESTIVLNEKIRPGYVQVAIFRPFQETPLYDYCIKNNLIDFIKLEKSTSCFDDSVLRGVSLVKRRNEIEKHFNTQPFLFGVDW